VLDEPGRRTEDGDVMTPETSSGTVSREDAARMRQAAIASARHAYTLSIQIHVRDLQQWADKMRPTFPPNEWARVQGAINGLTAAMSE